MRTVMPFVLFATCSLAVAQAPEVESLTPAAGDAEVDASMVKQLVVKFDRDMNTGGMSVVGGGPAFPELDGRPQWQDARTLAIPVKLKPDHSYSLALNSHTHTNFRSKEGAVLLPVPWQFTTLPTELPPVAKQKRRNKRALTVLLKTLEERYSYYDLNVDDWDALVKEHREHVLAARTDRGFAAAAAKMLRATDDLHLYLRCGEQGFATGTRSVDALYREALLKNYVELQQAGPRAIYGRTDDNIGYLMVGAWTADIDTDKIGAAIASMKDTKALIVDVRANGGGDEMLARQVAGWFVEGAKVYAKNRYRERAGKDGFGEELTREISGHGGDRRYEKPVVLLISPYVMSSNEAFVLMMKQARDCLVVGQPTYGSSGNPKPFELGNDVTVFVPSWQAMRPDGTVFEGEGIEPDEFVPCTASDLERRDPILEKALELLRARVGE